MIKTLANSRGGWLKKEFFSKGMVSPAGIGLLSFVAVVFAILFFTGYKLIPFLAVGGLIGLIVLYLCFFKPYVGFFIVTLIAFFAFYPKHILNIDPPFSTLVAVLMWIVFLGSTREVPPKGIKNSLLSTPVAKVFILYTAYHLIEFFNPDMYSKAGYIFVMRKFFMFIIIYISAYRLINTPSRFRFFLKFWIVMAFIAALYGCYQHWFGYLPPEMSYLRRHPKEYDLMFQSGQMRIFSFLSDVVSFGVLAGTMCVVSVVLAINEKRKKEKYILFLMAFIMFLGMSYSGTRTTTIIVPVGISIYLLMTIKNRTTLITLFATVLAILFVLFAPIYTPSIQRMRSTFDPENASLNVRDENRHYIQPYIYAHPIGGGLATAGVAGRQYNPTHPLAGFPPDSGFLQMALEIGWIGLGLTVIFYLTILYQGVYHYFRIRNPEYKVYAVALVGFLLSIMVTQYSQVSIGQIPGIILFMSAIGMSKRLFEFDEAEHQKNQIILRT